MKAEEAAWLFTGVFVGLGVWLPDLCSIGRGILIAIGIMVFCWGIARWKKAGYR